MTLEEQAEVLYPMPERPCEWNRKRVLFKRRKWIEKQTPKQEDE